MPMNKLPLIEETDFCYWAFTVELKGGDIQEWSIKKSCGLWTEKVFCPILEVGNKIPTYQICEFTNFYPESIYGKSIHETGNFII